MTDLKKNMTNTNSLSQNRAEEFGFDLSKDFVLPPIYEKIDFQKTAKPKIFIGGRGSGKTMFLRYLSHQTTFSNSKSKITQDDIDNIGLYWKVDTHIVHLLQKRGLEEDVWQAAFEHLITILLLLELIKSIESIANSSFDKFKLSELKNINIESLSSLGIDFSGDLIELKDKLKILFNEFQLWLRNVRKGVEPKFIPKTALDYLVDKLKNKIPCIKESNFNIYIDEYENLIDYQQKIINTWLKHSEIPVVFHLAMKRNAFRTRETTGAERLSDVHDYRIHDLEENFSNKKEFMVFAAEIILFRLHNQSNLQGLEFDSKILIDHKRISDRKTEPYQKSTLNIIDKIFPSITHKELANGVLDDKSLVKKVIEKLNLALLKKESKVEPNLFFYYDDMRITLVCISLLHRPSITIDSLLSEINKLKEGKSNKFFNSTDWVKNNFVGSYLLFYSSLNRVCPLYTGFRTFCEMSNGNIRHLTELCYKTFLRTSDKNTKSMVVDIGNIDIIHEAQAAKQSSTTFLKEIKTFGRHGNQLHTFVLRLGTLFALAHKNPKQSEPEQNHFSIVSGGQETKVEAINLLNEAVKWSVIFEHKSTKKKSTENADFTEYVLNPIYAPYFHISYRKKRKLEINNNSLSILLNGSLDDYENLLKVYKSKWDIDSNDENNSNLNLFSNLKI
jgi:hypothetical protein